MSVFIKQCYFSKINTKINKPEIISFLKSENSIYSILAVAKSAAEPENSNNRHTANSSTPLIRAFFVCDIHSSNERLETLRGSERPYELGMSVFGHTPILSMVACSGKGSPFAAYRVRAVSQPVTRYRPNPEKFSGSPKNLHTELSAMIYKFLTLTGNKRLKITVQANSKAEALSRIQFTNKPLLVARLRNATAKNPQNMTACEGVIYA
ncbi:ash family protein [Mannheimia haemolytica]|uniref:ash family protein n=1 Tax=Mannheimia haemolytica TaxID=75985 RepID=UPI0005CADBC5|nr:ash family protein [Mannheimia haemolytica]HDL1260445.1 ash family protein [Mannheimia haemolytica]